MDDPYIWLENLEDPKTKKFIEEHNRKLREFLGDLPQKLLKEVERYFYIPYIIQYKATEGRVYVLFRDSKGYHVVALEDGEVRKILSSRELGEEITITGIYANRKGDILGLTYSRAGSDRGFLRILDAETLEKIDEIGGYISNVVWIDRERYYYVRAYRRSPAPDGVKPPAWRVFLREVGGKEEIVFGSGLESKKIITFFEPWEEGKIFAVIWKGWGSTAVYSGPIERPDRWQLTLDGGKNKVIPVGFINGVPYLAVYDGNGFGRIVKVENGEVKEVVKERQNEPLEPESVTAVSGRIYAVYLVNASSMLRIYDKDGNLEMEHKPTIPSTITYVRGAPGRNEVYMLETGFHTPPILKRLRNGSFEVVYSTTEPLDIEVNEEWCKSRDGTDIHMFIVKKRGSKPRRAIVYGYGGFAISITPFFLSAAMPFIDEGDALVVSNLRGGGEYGEEWHKAGMKENKQNVFDDFKAVLAHVRAKGWKTIGWGSSNGGLLIAAAVTQYPELLDAALIGYPLTDMLRFHLLYLGKLWTTEYGDPENPEDRKYLEKYSPYHNVRPGRRYPPTLIYTGLHDDRVHPAHALKFAARLEEVGAPVHLRVETKSGHSGATPEIKAYEYADLLAFIEKVVPKE